MILGVKDMGAPYSILLILYVLSVWSSIVVFAVITGGLLKQRLLVCMQGSGQKSHIVPFIDT